MTGNADAFDWSSIFSNDMNVFWSNWYKVFLNIMEQAIPKVSISSKRNLPWFNHEIRMAMRKRDTLFKKSGLSHRYKIARNKVTSLLWKAKHRYFQLLNPVDTKKFWKSVRYIDKKQSSIPVLQCTLMKLMNRRHQYSIPFFRHALTSLIHLLILPLIHLINFINSPVKIWIVLLKKLEML